MMKTYLSFFRIRFTRSLQYRAAAFAGILTQFAWGGMLILLFRAFYESNPQSFPMPFSSLATYVWLQQALLTLLSPWAYNKDIMDSIQSGTIAYELCRPVDCYAMWYVKNLAERLSKVCLRGLPILVVAAFIPSPYGFTLPADGLHFLLFIVSVILGNTVVISLNMLLFTTAFYTTSTQGTRMLFATVTDFLCGGILPLPFFPAAVLGVLKYLPFTAVQNTPFLLYTGYYRIEDAVFNIGVQVVWIFILVISGRMWLSASFKKVTVLGG